MKTWSEHDVNVLRVYAPDGMDAICRRLPAKTRQSVFSKASELKIKIAKPAMEYDPNAPELENKTWVWHNRIAPQLTVVGECHEWNGSNSKGYGQIRFFVAGKKRIFSTHRIALEVKRRELIPEGLSALHRCDNPKCNNADHLFTGDDAANVSDMHSKGRAKGMYMKGMAQTGRIARGINKPCAKLDEDKVREARRIYDSGEMGHKLLAKKFHVSPRTMQLVVKRMGWKHVT